MKIKIFRGDLTDIPAKIMHCGSLIVFFPLIVVFLFTLAYSPGCLRREFLHTMNPTKLCTYYPFTYHPVDNVTETKRCLVLSKVFVEYWSKNWCCLFFYACCKYQVSVLDNSVAVLAEILLRSP